MHLTVHEAGYILPNHENRLNEIMYNSLFYCIAKFLLRALISIFIRLDVKGRENIPRKPGFLLVSNHISYPDPLIIGVIMPFPVYFMAKKEAFKRPINSRLLSWLGAFPVERNKADIASLRKSIRLLGSGKTVAMFPSGGIVRDNARTKGKEGIALIAYESKAEILPVFITGTRQLYSPRWLIPKAVKISLRIGKPFSITANGGANREARRQASNKIMDSIHELEEMK